VFPFCEAEWDLWQQAGDDSLTDTCRIRIPPADSSPDALGYADRGTPDSWPMSDPLACGITLKDTEGTVGRVRVSLSVSLPDTAQIVLTHRRGKPLPTPIRYRITHGPRAGLTCQIVDVQKAYDETWQT